MSKLSSPQTQYVAVGSLGNPKRVGRPAKLPANVHPLTKSLFEMLEARGMTDKDMSRLSGVSHHTIADWRYRWNPSLPNLEACLNVLGYELTIRERDQ